MYVKCQVEKINLGSMEPIHYMDRKWSFCTENQEICGILPYDLCTRHQYARNTYVFFRSFLT